jgi:hypothetical protein
MILSNGFFPRFLRSAGYEVDVGSVAVSRRYEALTDVPREEEDRIATVRDLLARIPELQSLYVEMFDDEPAYLLYDRVGSDAACRLHFQRRKNWSRMNEAWIRKIMGWSESISLEEDAQEVRTEFRPVTDFELEKPHATVMADTSCVLPILGIRDVFLVEFVVLYVLSIWARYRPALWRDVSEGDQADFRAIVANLLSVVARTLPNEVLDRIYGRKFLFAGFSYFS